MPMNLNGPLAQEMMARESQAASPAPEDKNKGVGLLAKLIYGIGAGADAGSTAYGLSTGAVHEANPLVKWAGKKGAIPVGAAMEGGGLALLNHLIGKKHPDIMKALLMGAGALHGGLAVHNMSTIASAKHGMERDRASNPSDAVPSNLVRQPDGSWADPNYFPK